MYSKTHIAIEVAHINSPPNFLYLGRVHVPGERRWLGDDRTHEGD